VTTTDRARPAAPRSSSRNSRTSRPRSPTKASTATSQAVCRASMASKVDFPIPDPANKPRRWPSRQVANVLRTRTPRSSRGPSRARWVASGGDARTSRGRVLRGKAPRWSSGRPVGSMTRPSHPSHGARRAPRGRFGVNGMVALPPGPTPSSVSNAMTRASAPRKPTTSPNTGRPSRAVRLSRSPMLAWAVRPATSTESPATFTTRPLKAAGCSSDSIVAAWFKRSQVDVSFIGIHVEVVRVLGLADPHIEFKQKR